ncbi:hypothetical protein ACFOOP_06180 [Marinicaulis aureus]|uniref:Uncharacterized protein n=1 Tax=Hyphococcus aureus TaxID=2666033 RepID=A0ABW1KTN1_9PROT
MAKQGRFASHLVFRLLFAGYFLLPYRTLSAAQVIDTIDALSRRIEERFPGSGLNRVSDQLSEVARRCAAESERLRDPVIPIRVSVYSIWALGGAALGWIALTLHYDAVEFEAAGLVQVLEPAMNIAVLVGLGVVTLGRLEERWKRARALDYLHELRSIAHVVDMHQLTKDPYRRLLPTTASSPDVSLQGPLLERYLDYCSEMLSLTAKLAALFAQSCRDPEVVAGAGDIEQLTTALSRKIWQKIMAFSRYENGGGNTTL